MWQLCPTFQQLTSELHDSTDLGTWFPEILLEHTQTHCARVGRRVIGNVGVVNLGGEANSGWFERIVWWQLELEAEDTALVVIRESSTEAHDPYSVGRAGWAFHGHTPVEEVGFVYQTNCDARRRRAGELAEFLE